MTISIQHRPNSLVLSYPSLGSGTSLDYRDINQHLLRTIQAYCGWEFIGGDGIDTPCSTHYLQYATGVSGTTALTLSSIVASSTWFTTAPADIPAIEQVVDFDNGDLFSAMVLADGSIYAHGLMESAEFQSPYKKAGSYVKISAGRQFMIALRSDGTLEHIGCTDFGTHIGMPTGSNFVDVTSGHAHSVALDSEGRLHAWGNDHHGQVSGCPTRSGFVHVFANVFGNVATHSDGSITVWGQYADDFSAVTYSNALQAVIYRRCLIVLTEDGSTTTHGDFRIIGTIKPNAPRALSGVGALLGFNQSGVYYRTAAQVSEGSRRINRLNEIATQYQGSVGIAVAPVRIGNTVRDAAYSFFSTGATPSSSSSFSALIEGKSIGNQRRILWADVSASTTSGSGNLNFYVASYPGQSEIGSAPPNRVALATSKARTLSGTNTTAEIVVHYSKTGKYLSLYFPLSTGNDHRSGSPGAFGIFDIEDPEQDFVDADTPRFCALSYGYAFGYRRQDTHVTLSLNSSDPLAIRPTYTRGAVVPCLPGWPNPDENYADVTFNTCFQPSFSRDTTFQWGCFRWSDGGLNYGYSSNSYVVSGGQGARLAWLNIPHSSLYRTDVTHIIEPHLSLFTPEATGVLGRISALKVPFCATGTYKDVVSLKCDTDMLMDEDGPSVQHEIIAISVNPSSNNTLTINLALPI